VVVHLSLKDAKLRWKLWASVALMALLGVIFYQFCPAAGPVYVFPGYPRIPTVLLPSERLIPYLIPNCTPSVHLAMAVLALLYAKSCGRFCRAFAWVFVALTVFVTLGLGEHYFIDLVLAIPFAVGIESVVNGRRKKAYGFLLLVIAWEVALRFGWALHVPAAAALLLSGLTAVIPCLGPLRPSEARLAPIVEAARSSSR